MQNQKQNTTSHGLEMTELPENSPDQIMKSSEQLPLSRKSSWNCNIKRCMFLLLAIISSTILISQINAIEEPPIVDNELFTFLVYCPYSYKDKIAGPKITDQNVDQGLRRRMLYTSYSYSIELTQKKLGYDWNSTYVVQIQSRMFNNAPTLVYCGLVTDFGSSCDIQVKYRCSTPGPMFDLKTSSFADIVWINNLNQQIFVNDSCIASGAADPHCKLASKEDVILTFPDPTSTHMNSGTTVISSEDWPASTHVHGAEVRPTFDGNPLSWITNSGKRGVGAFSLTDKCYYDKFDQYDVENNYYLPPQITVRSIENPDFTLPFVKVNRYPNIQNPGNLWYHDHAMRLTLYNVQNGLSGLYMLRQDKVELEIGVDKSNEKLVMMTTSGWKSSRLETPCDIVTRFRFLNNNFGNNQVWRVFFTYQTCEAPKNYVPFTIIGADSSLFNEGIYNQISFIVAQAERIQLLIKFDSAFTQYSICTITPTNPFPVPASSSKVKPTADNPLNIQRNRLIKKIDYKAGDLNNRTSIDNVKLSVPYVSFDNPNLPIAVKRMRPLMNVQTTSFTINGRGNFHDGKSENPTIGTYEDWYIINTFTGPHPIHIHLINFQVVKILTLRNISTLDSGNNKVTCTLYELDFLIAAINKGSQLINDPQLFPSNKPDYRQICLQKNTKIYSSPNFGIFLNQVNVEDEIDSGRVSGINVEKIATPQEKALLIQQGVVFGQNDDGKYATNQINTILPYYRRWKDTASVDGYKAFVFRMRWAKSAYNDNNPNDPYFHVPMDQLREYPGFVYHCHILFHEDNEMMRPIMLQLPKNAKLNENVPCNNLENNSWDLKYKCINELCSPGKY